MVNGINFITDEKGRENAILLDLVAFKREGVKAEAVLAALSDLQKLIDSAGADTKKPNNWDLAKEKLKNIKS